MTVDTYELLCDQVRRAVERRRLRPESDFTEVRAEVVSAVDEYQQLARSGPELPLVAPDQMTERVFRAITQFGALSDLLERRDVEEIFVEGARVSYLDDTGRLRGLAAPTSETENRAVVDRLLAATDRQLNTRHPIVQARVLGGTARLTAAIPPVADQLSATLRRYVVRNVTLDHLVDRGSLTASAARFARTLMRFRSRLTVSGEPGAGKTTLAAALLGAAPSAHCIRVCEEIRELSVPFTHGSYYEVRPPGLDGTGEITLRDLVKFVLAMRPDRIVVGEVRGAEAFELSRAVNAGCGFLCTVHANRAADALDALVNAALMAGENVNERIVRRIFSEALDVVIHVDRETGSDDDGDLVRQVTEIAAVVPALRDGFTLEPLFVRADVGSPLRWTGAMPDRLAARMGRVVSADELRALLEHPGPRWSSSPSSVWVRSPRSSARSCRESDSGGCARPCRHSATDCAPGSPSAGWRSPHSSSSADRRPRVSSCSASSRSSPARHSLRCRRRSQRSASHAWFSLGADWHDGARCSVPGRTRCASCPPASPPGDCWARRCGISGRARPSRSGRRSQRSHR